ncbi:MAG TPA: DNA-3-methyladenine glycosylase 2 family protein [Micromonosporaceae bacterium]
MVVLRGDPAVRLGEAELWWASRTPDGPGTLHLRRDGGELVATGYGPGAGWLVEHADAIAGLRDDLGDFPVVATRHPVVREAYRRLPGLRLPRSGQVFQHLVPTIVAQKVSGMEAARGYRRLANRFGEPAPGPVDGLLLPPDPQVLAATPYWVFHPFGIEQRRADAVRRAAAVAARLDRCATSDEAGRHLRSVPGIGGWTVAEVVRVSHGDPDAVSVGDYNLPHQVAYALTGQARAGARDNRPGELSPADARMLELLEPFRGHRARVCRLLLATGARPPRFGPRAQLRSFARF